MAELDIEKLKRQWIFQFPRTLTLTRQEADAIIAALEDRDRLQRVIDQHNIQRVMDESHEEGWALAARIIDQEAEIARLEAALEGRDGSIR